MPEENLTNQPSSNQPKNGNDVEANKIIAAMSYIWILCLIPLLTKRDSKFSMFHAKQGLVLFIAELVVSLLFFIPFLSWLLWILLVIVSIIGVIKAYSGEWWKIPYVYDLSQKINL